MKSHTPLRVGAIALASALALSACTGGAPGDAATTGTLHLYSAQPGWNWSGLSEVSEEQIDIALDASDYSQGDEYEALIKQSLRTNKAPGIFTWPVGPALDELIDAGLIAETTDLWEEQIAAGNVQESLAKYYTRDGKQYCFPISVDDWVIYYNKHSFEAAGITEPPTTWDELIEASEALKAVGITPFWNQSGLWSFVWFQTLIAGTDLDLYNRLATGDAKYTDPEVVDIMNYWLELQQDGYFSNPGDQEIAEIQLRDQNVAMTPFGTWWTGAAIDNGGMALGEDFGMFPIPSINPDQPNGVAIETRAMCVGEKSDERALGLEYSKWWFNTEAQQVWSNLQRDLPFNPNVTAAEPDVAELGQTIGSGNFEYYLRYYEAAPPPVLTAATDALTGFMTNPGDPVPVLEAIQEAADKYWAENK